MNLVLEPRHWMLMGFAALLGLVGYFILPSVLPVFSTTALAFPLIAGAASWIHWVASQSDEAGS